MAERTFDYAKIAEIYKSMNQITGDAGTPDSIAGILHLADEEMFNKVNVSEQAIYGDLGSQLKLDWDNFSSNFPNFVANFNNWATAVATANNDYSQFEQDVQGFRDTHKFGVAAAEGMTASFVDTGYYADAYSEEDLAKLREMAHFYELTGATYIDTGMESFAKRNTAFNVVTDLLSVAAVAASGVTVANAVRGAVGFWTGTYGAGGITRLQAMSNWRNVASIPKLAADATLAQRLAHYGAVATAYAGYMLPGGSKFGTAFWNGVQASARTVPSLATAGVAAGGGLLSNIGSAIGQNYDINRYGSGLENANPWGDRSVTVDGTTYTHVVNSENGTQLYVDYNTGNVFYGNGNSMNPVTIDNGDGTQRNVNLDDLAAPEFTIYCGNEAISSNDGFNAVVGEGEYRSYGESIPTSVETRGKAENIRTPAANVDPTPTEYPRTRSTSTTTEQTTDASTETTTETTADTTTDTGSQDNGFVEVPELPDDGGTETPGATETPAPTETPTPTPAPGPAPTGTPAPTETPVPTGTPAPTETPVPTGTPAPTEQPVGTTDGNNG